MSFTDEDSKRLKEYIKASSWRHYFETDDMENLLSRLEAAEKAANHFSKETVLNECCVPIMKSWLKARGK